MRRSTSESEGEIRETDRDKANMKPPTTNSSSVNRAFRSRASATNSPEPFSGPDTLRRSRERSRSPFRHDSAPRGAKRNRDEAHFRDPREYKVRPHNDYRRHHKSYADLEQPVASSRYDRRNSHDRPHGRDSRDRSRSPYRAGRYDNNDRQEKDVRHYDSGRKDGGPARDHRNHSGRERGAAPTDSRNQAHKFAVPQAKSRRNDNSSSASGNAG
ncbi:hypothetical protein LTS18_013840, partial [Coniosporium uncinatum]